MAKIAFVSQPRDPVAAAESQHGSVTTVLWELAVRIARRHETVVFAPRVPGQAAEESFGSLLGICRVPAWRSLHKALDLAARGRGLHRSDPMATSFTSSSSRARSSAETDGSTERPVGPPLPSHVLHWRALQEIAAARAEDYRGAKPFPHAQLDGLFAADLLDQAIAEMPTAARWARYDTANERKVVCSEVSAFGPAGETLVHALNSAPFVRFLERLTGIQGLIPDPHLHAAGYMKVAPGGFLGLHYDFSTQQDLGLDRRVNVLLYLNRDWRTEWGGQLELHSNDPLDSDTHTAIEIEPAFNRLVIFNTPQALHGHRRAIACPPDRARLCLSWYYYTAPPVPGWAARGRKVHFVGWRDPVRMAIRALNLLCPPILLTLASRIGGEWREQRRGK